MASPASSTPSFFFADSGKKNKENTPKALENPLLLRGPPVRPSNNHYALTATSNGTGAQLLHNDGTLAIVHSQNGDMGLRQRKKVVNDSFGPPPRASWSTGTGVDLVPSSTKQDKSLWNKPHTENPLVPSTTAGCWVLIYGYASTSHYNEILHLFSAYGHVLDRRGTCQPTRSNWVALQYESRLQAEKALCHQHVQLADGIFCGVKRLDDNDPILLQTAADNSGGLWTLSNTTSSPREGVTQERLAATAFGNGSGGGSGGATFLNGQSLPQDNGGGLKEKDILLLPSKQTSFASEQRRKTNLCEKILRWFLSIE